MSLRRSKVVNEPLNSSLECTLTASLDQGVADITTNRKAVRASRPVCPLVPWRLRLPASQNIVSGLLLFSRVLRVRLARVDQEGHAGLLELLQVIRGLEERGVRDDSGLDQAVECEVEDVPRAEAVAGCAELRDALLL